MPSTGTSSSRSESDDDDLEIARVRALLETRLLGASEASIRIGRFVVIERIGSGGMGVVIRGGAVSAHTRPTREGIYEKIRDTGKQLPPP